MIVTFAGHSLISSNNRVKEMVKEYIRNNICGKTYITAYLGGYGDFDELCACACRELKRENFDIEIVYVTPYFDLLNQEKIKEMQKCGLYDTSIYPPIENVPAKFAILKRNEWMITNADLVIVYVNHSYGGAYKSLQIAKRKKKKVVNICDFL